MLVNELQTVVDTKTADAAAPRIAVINKRFQDAGIQVFALNGTALLRSSDRPSEYNDTLVTLVREMGRIRASKPVTSADGEVDRDALVKAVGAANAGDAQTDAQRAKAGTAYYKDSIDQSHSSAGEFSPYYGSSALAEALAYEADPSSAGTFTFGEDVAPVPDAVEVADSDEEVAPDDEEDATFDDEEEVIDEDVSEDVVDDEDDEEVIDEDETDSDDSDDDEDSDDSLDIDFGDIGI